MADGSARRFNLEKTKDQLKWLIMRNDGHQLDFNRIGNLRLSSSSGTSSSSSSGSTSSSSSRSLSREELLASPEVPRENRNNLKQLMLAMHNYHDVNQHFPPAVVMGPDGKTPHSWRVELLAYLGPDGVSWQRNVALFKQYRLNEPWDSENNKKVLARMPDAFRSPYGDPNSTATGYFALVGPGTVFEGPKGVRLIDITDGTSNTLAIVEAKRNIPWTKPEDIPFDADKGLPGVGRVHQRPVYCRDRGWCRTQIPNRPDQRSAQVAHPAKRRPPGSLAVIWPRRVFAEDAAGRFPGSVSGRPAVSGLGRARVSVARPSAA